jgi:predicted RNase H-like HicB family nuclease
MNYLVVIEQADDGSYSAYVPDLPGCVSCSDSIEDIRSEIGEAIRLHLEFMREQGEPIPVPTALGHLVKV